MSNTTRKIVALNVQYFRQKLGLSQEALGFKCNMTNVSISRIESAKVGIGIDALTRIAKALKVPAYQLLMPEPPE
ncbi:MAG: helix-turn-helix transcriptional regulator [Candidatus Kapaibacterium sp.]